MPMQRPVRSGGPDSQALLSHSTILILSGYLIGSGSAPGLVAGMGEMALGGGLCGLLAYFGLRRAAVRQARRDAELALRRAIRNMEIRIDRHIPRQGLLSRPRTARPAVPSHRQYVTVVRSPQMR